MWIHAISQVLGNRRTALFMFTYNIDGYWIFGGFRFNTTVNYKKKQKTKHLTAYTKNKRSYDLYEDNTLWAQSKWLIKGIKAER